MPQLKRHLSLICVGLGVPFCAYAAHDHRLETVEVYGTQAKLALEAEQALTPGGVTVLDSEAYRQRNIASMADMLRYVPGVWATNGSNGDSTFFSSRGSNLDAVNYDGNGIKLMQDGLPVTAADGNNHNRNIDPLSARYVIVAKGANALTYGASTLGGAIDFISPTARDSAALESSLNLGSHGQRQGRVTAGAVEGAFDGLLTLESRRWDGFRDHQSQQRESLYANAGWQLSEGTDTRLYVTYIDNDQGLPGPLTEAEVDQNPKQAQVAAVDGDFQVNVETWRVANKTRWELSDSSSLSLGVSYEEQDLYHPIVFGQFFSLLIDTEQRNAGATLRYQLQRGDHDLLVGLNYGQTEVKGGNFSHDGQGPTGLMTEVDNEADSLELFLMDRWQFAPRWTAVYGAQFVDASREVRNVDTASGAVRNPRGDYDSVNPRAGLIYALLPEVELFANISKLYEAPTTYELEDDARGNQETLDAMHGVVAEVGTRGTMTFNSADSLHWDVALYYAELKDEILSIDDPAAPGTSLATNVDNTLHAGLEALIGASVALDDNGRHRIEPLLSLTVNHFSFDDDPVYRNNDLPAAPGYALKGEVLYRNSNGFFAGPTFDVIDERYADFTNSYKIDGYTLLGLRMGLSRETWEVFVEARNLTDRDYIAVHSVRNIATASDAILNPGEPRSVYLGVNLQF